MKKTYYWSIASLFLLSIAIYGFAAIQSEDPVPVQSFDNTKIQWYSMEEALAAHEKSPKKLFIDMYTSWCGWCKVMDQKTFTDADVIQFINENFYPVKFNAEQTEVITFRGRDYKFVKSGRRGIHELAYMLLDRQAGYPSFVMLDEDLDRLGIIKGFKAPEPFLKELKQYTKLQ